MNGCVMIFNFNFLTLTFGKGYEWVGWLVILEHYDSQLSNLILWKVYEWVG